MTDEIKDVSIPTISLKADGTTFFGISARAIIAILLVLTVCIMSIIGIPVIEPIYSLAIMVVGFYFGHVQGAATKTKL